MKQRRTVHLNLRNPKATGFGGGHYTVYGYTKLDLAVLFDVKQTTIRNWICRKKFDPNDLSTIITFYNSRAKKQDMAFQAKSAACQTSL
jgi:hypothetical protein